MGLGDAELALVAGAVVRDLQDVLQFLGQPRSAATGSRRGTSSCRSSVTRRSSPAAFWMMIASMP